MSDLVLYTHPRSRGRIAHWMVEEAGQPHHIQWMAFGPGTAEQLGTRDADFLALNPMGKLPVLRHGEAVVTEAAAICTYLAAAFPDRGLMPSVGDPALGSFYRWIFFGAGPLEAAVTARAMGWDVPKDRRGTVGFGHLDAVLDVLSHALTSSPYLCGTQFTAADVYVGSQLAWAMAFGTIDKRAEYEDYLARLMVRPAFTRTDQINEARLAAMGANA